MEPHETSPATTRPHDAADEEITADDAITVDEAILLAKKEHGLTVPKSTLQRWLKQDRIKCVLNVGRYGRKYLIDREDWLAKSFDIFNNDALRHEASQDPTGSGETSSDTATPHEAPQETTEKITELEQENLNLKIDKSARDQIIAHLKNERGAFIEELQNKAHRIGQLEIRLQLSAPATTSVMPAGEGKGDKQEEGASEGV